MMGCRCTRHFSGNDSNRGITEHDGSWQHTRISLRRRSSRNFMRKESRVDEANKVQMMKKCEMRRCSKLYIRFRLQKSRKSMTMEP